jgi:hypothetical protein
MWLGSPRSHAWGYLSTSEHPHTFRQHQTARCLPGATDARPNANESHPAPASILPPLPFPFTSPSSLSDIVNQHGPATTTWQAYAHLLYLGLVFLFDTNNFLSVSPVRPCILVPFTPIFPPPPPYVQRVYIYLSSCSSRRAWRSNQKLVSSSFLLCALVSRDSSPWYCCSYRLCRRLTLRLKLSLPLSPSLYSG